MAARSYLGVPLIGTGSVIVGHIFLMDDKRLADPSRTLHMLTQVAGRAAMEVERFRRDRSGRAAEFRLRFILESLADGVLVIDSQGIVTYLNEQVVSLVGHSGVDIIGKPLSQFLETEKTEEGKPLPDEGDIQVRFRCSDNTFRAATLQAKPLTDAARRVIGTVFLVRPAAD
jgi:PAS domain S-box-containing protein